MSDFYFFAGPDHPDKCQPGPEPVVVVAVAAAAVGPAAGRPAPLDHRPRPLDIPAGRGGPQCRQEAEEAGQKNETCRPVAISRPKYSNLLHSRIAIFCLHHLK